jgi:hypothetical protein
MKGIDKARKKVNFARERGKSMSEKTDGISRLIELNSYLRANYENMVARMSDKMSDAEIAKELGLDLATVQRLKNDKN